MSLNSGCGRKIGEFDCCSVVEGDGVTILNSFSSNVIDAIVTDPPFGIDFSRYISCNDSSDGYGNWIRAFVQNSMICLKGGAPLFLWQSATSLSKLNDWLPYDKRIFISAKNFVQMRKRVIMQWAYDVVVCIWKEGEQWKNVEAKSTRDFFISNTAALVSKPLRLERQHPCPRPLDVVEYIVEGWCKPGAVILDPFCGSGTTLVAAKMLGRHFLGIDIEPKYCEIARQRLAEIPFAEGIVLQ